MMTKVLRCGLLSLIGMFLTAGLSQAGGLYLYEVGSPDVGLSLDDQNDWAGRYYVQEATLQAAGIHPAIAWKVNDQFSVGAGAGVLYGMMEEKVAINNIDPFAGDGQLKNEDEDWTVQFNLGLLCEPSEGTSFDLTYLSEADLNFPDEVELSSLGSRLESIRDHFALPGTELDLSVSMPQSVMSSVYHEFTDRLALLANLGWQDWSQFGYVDIGVHSIDSTDITADLDFQDTWHVALGVQYRLSEPWLLPGGVAYDSTIYDGDEVSPALPVDENWRFDIGSNYDWSKDLTLGAAYELAWGGDLDVDVDRGPLVGELSGSYENLAIHIICLNAEWRL